MKANSFIKISVSVALLLFSTMRASSNDRVVNIKSQHKNSPQNFKLSKIQKSSKYKLENENLVFSFKTKNSKMMSLCIDKNEQYIVYRFGTADNIELEFPTSKDKNSFNNFVYTGWDRGGGVRNEGMNLNYIAFEIKDYKYIIYETYFAVGDVFKVGVRIINLKTNKEVDIRGLNNTIKGTLSDFRTDDRIKKGDRLYD
ncbi:hypothetical protein [Soonwooa sp.]|uniref:hypothetical protein n=1 Tax=Soonwooa sp. TaxID=1938592 RepID=UPI00263375F4|nr:hypothetical protein [Soonwooa sp.]